MLIWGQDIYKPKCAFLHSLGNSNCSYLGWGGFRHCCLPLWGLADECRELIHRHLHCFAAHIHRERNVAADALTKMGIGRDVGLARLSLDWLFFSFLVPSFASRKQYIETSFDHSLFFISYYIIYCKLHSIDLVDISVLCRAVTS